MIYKNKDKSRIIIKDSEVQSSLFDSTSGGTLENALREQDKRIGKLEGNVKWLYAYGGVGGTGGGGGGGESSGWNYYVLLQPAGSEVSRINDNSAPGTEPAAVNKGMATLTLAVRNPGEDTSYSVTVRYEGITYPSSIVLSPSNSWRTEINIELTKNGSIYIEYVNQSTMSPLSMTYNYVVNPFVVTSFVFKANTEKYPGDAFVYDMGSTNIYLEDINEHGIVAVSQYTCNLSGTYEYTWEVDGISLKTKKEVSLNDTGDISIDLEPYLAGQVTSNTHSVSLLVGYQQKNTTSWIYLPEQRRTVNVIPLEKTLAINPADGLYDSMSDTPPSESMMKNNNNAFSLQFTVFYGINKGRSCHLDLKSEQVGYATPSKSHGIYEITSTAFWGLSDNPTPEEIIDVLPAGTKVAAYNENNILSYYTLKEDANPFDLSGWTVSSYTMTPDTSIDFTEGASPSVSITPIRRGSGWYIMICRYSIGNEEDTVIKFFYDKVVDTSFKWWPSTLESLMNKLVTKRIGNSDTTITAMTSTSSEVVYNQFTTTEKDVNYVLNVGIQYNETSDETKPIITLDTGDSNRRVDIYQNKVIVSGPEGGEFSIFIDKTVSEEYDKNKLSNYHMLSLVQRFIKKEGQDMIYEICAYIDGVLQGVLEKLPKALYQFNKLTLKPGNYFINNLELAYIANDENESASVTNCYFDDYITYYYYTYKIKMYNNQDAVRENSRLLLNYLVNTHDKPVRGNGLIKVSPDIVSNLIKFSNDIPTLVVSLEKNAVISEGGVHEEFTVFEWMNSSYTPDDSGSQTVTKKNYKYPINNLYWITDYTPDWANPETSDILKKSRLYSDEPTETLGAGFMFYLKLQGTSTMSNKDKNFTLGLVQPESGEIIKKRLFSPNFYYDGGDVPSDIFLPEESYTLKADHVDSSHTNNVCMGNFVNEHTSDCLSPYISTIDWFKNMTGNAVDSYQEKFLKRCLTGFPYYMVLNVVDKYSQTSEYYFLGIYNFNLGRSSEYNLGYRNLKNNIGDGVYGSLFNDSTGKVSNGFTFISSKQDSSYNQGLVVAEVQDNTPLFDFSQFNENILFQKEGVKLHMFGDIVHSPLVTNYNSKIQEFVRMVSKAGGYIWERLNKKLLPIGPNADATKADNYYNIPGTVPDYKTQYTYSGNSYVVTTSAETATQSDLLNLLFDSENPESPTHRRTEYDSLIAYYATCMAFGMVDSVQKNLCIKTWNANERDTKFAAFFYDMDTCLGIDNQGNDSGYFCFSDFYKTKTEPSGSIYIDGEEHDVYGVESSIILRDFWPDREWHTADYDIESADYSNIHGYDIPSSYLWAIAKYAFSLNSDKDLVNPCSYWAKWRSVGGALETADSFVDKYFSGYMDKTSEAYWNLDYREKYLNVYGQNWESELSVSGNTTTYGYAGSLKGRRTGFVRDWLNKRLDIMDLYMNVTNITTDTLSDAACTTSVIAPYYDSRGIQLGDNIQINRCITTDGVGDSAFVSRNAPVDLVVATGDYSPLVVRKGGNYFKYILSDSTKYYRIMVNYSGAEHSSFGGSRRWFFIESLAPLLKTMSNKDASFTIISKNLDNITIEDNESLQLIHKGTFNFQTPKAHTISLTSSRNTPDFGGTLNISASNDYQALKTVKIDGSKISLNIDGNGLSVTKISANNIKDASNLIIQNVDSEQTEIQLNNAAANKMVFTTWTSDGSINLGNLSGYINIKPVELEITANPKVTDNTGNVKVLNINGISTLKKLTFKGFKKISIKNCPKLETVVCNDTLYTQASSEAVLQSFTMNGSIVKTLTLNNCNNLEALDVSSNTYLNELVLHGNMKTVVSSSRKLTSLSISSTSLNAIKWNNTEANEVDLTWCNPGVSFQCSNNNAVEFIRCYNTKGSPMENIGSLSSCRLLQRVYGHFRVKSGMFSSCNAFSIHGANLSEVKWKNRDVLESGGRVKPPYELITGNVNIYQSPTPDTRFMAEGDDYQNVTNLSLSTSLNSSFSYTKATIFDVYYVLWLVGVDHCTTLSSAFYSSSAPSEYKFNSAYNNNPNINMFNECGNVTDLSSSLNSCCSGIVQVRDELLRPLSSIVSLSYIFYTWDFVCSQNVFSGNTTLQNVSYFSPRYVLGDYNEELTNSLLTNETLLVQEVNKNGADNFGVFGEILRNNPRISGGGMQYFFRNCSYLKYKSDYEDVIPSGVTHLNQSFTSSYGDGELPERLSTLFVQPSNMVVMASSFMVKDRGTAIADTTVSKSGVTISLTDNFLNGFTNLTHISHDGKDNGTGGSSSFNFNDATYSYQSSFCGKGIRKEIPVNGVGELIFPYDIFKNSTKLKYINGFFSNAVPSGEYSNTVSLPGNLFAYTPNVINLDYMFANVKFNYTLSSIADGNSKNFLLCSGLESVKYMFANDMNITYSSGSAPFLSTTVQGNTTSSTNPQKEAIYLHSSIPYKFFYHGETTGYKTYHGTNEDPVIDSGGTPVYSGDTDTTISFKVPKATISNMEGCFMSADLDWYTYDNAFIDETLDNSQYIPFKYYLQGRTWTARKEDGIEDVAQSVKWLYDGEWDYDNSGSTIFGTVESAPYELNKLEDVIKISNDVSGHTLYSSYICTMSSAQTSQTNKNFCTPPDLFRYCTSSCNVKYLFYHSGCNSSTWYNGVRPDMTYGLHGRLCPWLLRPLSDIESTTGMFSQCKRILTYGYSPNAQGHQTDTKTLIPVGFFKTNTKIKNLEHMFEGLCLSNRTRVNEESFSGIDPKNYINISYTFYNIRHGDHNVSTQTRTIFSKVFSSFNNITTCKACFAQSDVKRDDRSYSERPQGFVNFEDGNFRNSYASPSLSGNYNYGFTYCGYGNAIFYPYNSGTSCRDLPSNTTTCNYFPTID